MSFTLEKFISLRPYLYHLTAAENMHSIKSARQLCPAIHFIQTADGRQNRERRKQQQAVKGKYGLVILRDQGPLKEGNIEWEQDWNMQRFVDHLNRHVFFWPGSEKDCIAYGRNHFERYRGERPIQLRIRTADLVHSETRTSPLFCRWNSGAPRISNGKRCPRGSKTFLPASETDFTAGKVVEVAFPGTVELPYSFEYLDCRDGVWRVDYASCIPVENEEKEKA